MAAPSVRATPAYRASRASHIPDTPGSRRTTSGTARLSANQLPDYEPPTFSLNPAAQRELAALVQSQSLKRLNHRLDEAQAVVTTAVAQVNDRLTEKKRAIAKRKRTATPFGSQDQAGDDDGAVARDLEGLQDNVTRMTQRMEETMRKMIDGKHNVEHMKTSLEAAANDARNNASTQASTQNVRSQRRPRRGSGSSDEDDDEEYEDFTPTDPTGGTQPQTAPVESFRKKLDDAKTRYQSHSLAARYTENEDYRNFKRVVHDAQHPDDEVAEPHPRTWFDEEDAPAPGVTTRGAAGADEDDDDDDDIAIQRTKISIKCPLTLQEFKDPLSSKKCNHSFEASAIEQMIRGSALRVGKDKAVQCPCAGCKETLSRADLHRDPVLLRKIKRIQRARELEEEDAQEGARNGKTQRDATLIDDEGDEDGADVDDLVERQTQMKAEPRPTATSASNAPPKSTAPINLGESSAEEAEDDYDLDE